MADYDTNEMYGQQGESYAAICVEERKRQLAQFEQLEKLYKNRLITLKMMEDIINTRRDPPLVINPNFMFIPQVTEKIDERIESRFDILDL